MKSASLLRMSDCGLYCPAGDFHIDPWRGVDRAVVTHGHSDHARAGSQHYLCHSASAPILHLRLGQGIRLQTVEYGETLTLGAARVSLHPAGHVLGSAQVRVEVAGEVWVVSGDYKCHADPTCTALEPVRCQTFITESTFGLPVYQWPRPETVFHEIQEWWAANQAQGLTSILLGYSLGKAQRLLAGLADGPGPLAVHPAVAELLPAYEAAGVSFPPYQVFSSEVTRGFKGLGLLIGPPAIVGTKCLRPLEPAATANASGWMRIRGRRRWQNVDRGFVLSDHADWPGLVATIAATGASSVGVTHGYTGPLARWLQEERGLDAWTVKTAFGDGD